MQAQFQGATLGENLWSMSSLPGCHSLDLGLVVAWTCHFFVRLVCKVAPARI